MSQTPALSPATKTPIIGEEAILARRYAGALYDLAAEQKAADAVDADMRGLRTIWQECPEWRAIATDPRLTNDEMAAAADRVAAIAGLNALTAQFLRRVALNRRLSALPLMIEDYLDIVATHRGEHRVTAVAAHALTAEQHNALTSAIARALGGKVELTVTQDASIMGGVIVKIGSNLIDASIKSRLERLERALLAGAA
ncbi:MAG: ATP synthase F1 subunit delta [Alphaproteobacteria bacterium]|nr:ATP synthase F1 subunit delta [Alphaproteobacteria bacterium]